MKIVLSKFLFFISITSVLAQTGSVKGTVKDKETGELLTGAAIIIKGTTKGTITDFDGNYVLKDIPAGEITLVCSFVSYGTTENAIKVNADKEALLDFELTASKVSLSEVEVVAKANRESENLLLKQQKEAVMATQAIGAQELSRKGVSDAEGAVTKISGISKQEGVKNVFVRGLGDRYNITTLNGFVLPSEDPEYRNISLDFFSNDMIQAVTVSKVFSSSMNGDLGGALIDIISKELISDSEFEIGISSSLNSETIGKDILQPEGMNRLGYSTASFGPYENYTTDYSFNTSLDPLKVNSPYNYGLSFSGGKRFLNKHRFFVAGAMSNKYRYEEGELRAITTTGAADPFVDMTYTRYNRNSSNLLLGNLELNFNKIKLSYNSLYIQSATAYHADIFGRDTERFQNAPDFSGYTRRQQMNDNSIFINQIMVKGEINERLNYNVGAAVNNISGKEPDRRFFRFPNTIVGGDTVELHRAENVNERFNTEINELAINPKFSIQYKLTDDSDNSSLIAIGYDGRISNKNFGAPIYLHNWNPRKLDILPEFPKNIIELDKHLNQDALNDDFEIVLENDTYTVERIMHAVYVDFVYQINNSITLNPGLRLDDIYFRIDYDVNRGSSVGSETRDELKLSPYLNAKFELNDKNHLRIGASQTYTVPQDREISPFVYYGFDGPTSGNPNLNVSTNYNLDIKWDYYISNSELITVNGFYKYLLDPIARVDVGNSAGVKYYENVSDHAVAAGIELEMRKKLWSQENKHNISLGLNASYIYSQMELNPAVFVQNASTPLEGAAPYILNSDLTYRLVSDGFTMNSTFVVNYLSDKLHTIGSMGYNSLIEESITTIDFVNSFKVKKNIGISLKALNLLNPAYKQTRKGAGDTDIPDVVTRSYKKGVIIDLSLNYKF
jgi:hypothetical protein